MRGPLRARQALSLRHAPLLPSPPPSRAAPHGLRAAEALPSARPTVRSPSLRLPARRGLPLSFPPRGASSRPQHAVPTPWPPLPLPGPRQVYKHQPGARFPGSTSPSPSSSPLSSNIHFRAREPGRAGASRSGVRLRTQGGGLLVSGLCRRTEGRKEAG